MLFDLPISHDTPLLFTYKLFLRRSVQVTFKFPSSCPASIGGKTTLSFSGETSSRSKGLGLGAFAFAFALAQAPYEL